MGVIVLYQIYFFFPLLRRESGSSGIYIELQTGNGTGTVFGKRPADLDLIVRSYFLSFDLGCTEAFFI